MRDLILAALIFGAIPFILWRPAVGIFLWVWISVMSPHRMAYGFAYDFPFAQTIAISTLIGILFSRENRRMPVTPVTVVLLLMVLWMNVTTFFAIDIKEAWPMYERVMKIQLMIFVSLFILHSKRHVQALMWVVTLSVAFFGIKGGFFTLRGGGESLVWGPEGSFIADNNHLALAVIMTIPLLYYLRNQASKRWVRLGLLGAMVLCGFSALGSYSRGALLAIAAMIGFLWSKSRSRAVTGSVPTFQARRPVSSITVDRCGRTDTPGRTSTGDHTSHPRHNHPGSHAWRKRPVTLNLTQATAEDYQNTTWASARS